MRLALLVLALSGCAVLREAVTEDRSMWSQQMRDDVDRCDREVVEGRWGWGRMNSGDAHHALPRSFSDARLACLRQAGWRI